MAADRGHPHAQMVMGVLLRESENFDEAFHYFKLGAEQGLTQGERLLGSSYAYGQGVATNLLEAMRWFERAAAKGDQKAVDLLAAMKKRLDHVRAHAANGNEEAIAELAKYFKPA